MSKVMTGTTASPKSSTSAPIVLVADKLAPEGIELLRSAGLQVRVQQGLSPDELVAAVADVDGIIVRSSSRITADVVEAAPRLKAVGRAGIGVDNIDLSAASQHGVLVMNTPLANATTTAELAIAHLFGLARHTARAQASMNSGKWEKSALVGREVTAKTLAVIGLGKIGRIVADRGLGLRMKVIAYDPFLTGDSPVKGVELVDLDTALREADFVTIHVPRTDDTTGLFNAAALAKMKSTACLINCARGGLVVEDDLLDALRNGIIAGAALDVFVSEPLPEDSPLRELPNLLLTPHLGASSSEAQQRVSTEIAQQMIDFLLHGEARCAVNAPTVSAEEMAVLRPYTQLARRAALMLSQTSEGPIQRVEIIYRGELARQATAPVRLAVISGLLAPSLDGPVNDVNAEALATERCLHVLEEHDLSSDLVGTSIEIRGATTDGKTHSVAGTVFAGQPRLTQFEGFGVDFVPQGNLLLTQHSDAPGVLGQLATWLGDREINIGGLHMGAPREDTSSDSALALFALTRPLEKEELVALTDLSCIISARSIVL
jgi:D-3-phosphoglycerate dehydrogenase